jgi:formylglycine-generating enzyme
MTTGRHQRTKPPQVSRAGRFAGMVRLTGGTFLMGSEEFYEEERPVRPATVGGFWIDETPVTNAQFARFVKATGHVTFAEIAPDPAEYPGMDPALAVPGSMVFTPPAHPVPLEGPPSWWRILPGANWRHPVGPDSSLAGLERHPVVHVGHSDAMAYAAWAGKSLPTEAEWEYAARGGLDAKRYAWGDELHPGGRMMAKIWQGAFPWANDAPAGLECTSAVKSYPRNGYGLYDMIGNVWEWTADDYDRAGSGGRLPGCCGGGGVPTAIVRKVVKGGSHLCAPEYCQRYRPAARWPQPIDATTTHMGFRCVIRL